MRSGVRAAIAAASAVPALILTSLTAAVGAPPAGSSTISYHGTTISVPRGWPVYDLAKDPTRCVRLDRHAVYLGTPGANQACPAHLVGRTETLLVQPYRGGVVQAEPDAVQATQGQALVTASYGAAGAAAARRLLPRAASTPPRPAAPKTGTTTKPSTPTTLQGAAFDACAAPSREALQRWSTTVAPYQAIGIYIGGLNRGCAYGNLSAPWVRAVRSYGYRFIPTYVGRQAPCSHIGTPITPGQASEQGLDAARNALSNLAKFGFGKGNPVYLDMEGYSGDVACREAVLSFVNAWVYRLHLSGFRAGLYTSSWSSIVMHHNDGFHNPDVIWIGRWNNKATVFGDPVVPDTFWTNHQRIHQYKGSHKVRYAGVTLEIDTDEVDGPVG
ncbi:MAG TPA: DUF1906 domain-containing protein [Mycobacteriales bacterium]|nr:DUF1906 domain-containing protein [Mycobacteriales bacterium]